MVLPFTGPPVNHKELEVAYSQEMKLGSPNIHSQVFGTIFPFFYNEMTAVNVGICKEKSGQLVCHGFGGMEVMVTEP
jgi:hypothetical protein